MNETRNKRQFWWYLVVITVLTPLALMGVGGQSKLVKAGVDSPDFGGAHDPYNLQPTNVLYHTGDTVNFSWDVDSSIDYCVVTVDPGLATQVKSGHIKDKKFSLSSPSFASHNWFVTCYEPDGKATDAVQGLFHVEAMTYPNMPIDLAPNHVSLPSGSQTVELKWILGKDASDYSVTGCNLEYKGPNSGVVSVGWIPFSGTLTMTHTLTVSEDGDYHWQVECYRGLGTYSGWSIAGFDVGAAPTPTPTPTATPVATDEPVIFIAGIAGSQLLAAPDNYFWPVYRDDPKLLMTLKAGYQNDQIYTDDVIRIYKALNIRDVPIYDSFTKRMGAEYHEYLTYGIPARRSSKGCDKSQKDATFFVFPWDWRYGAAVVDDSSIPLGANNVALLKEYVDCVRQIHPNTNVKIIAHSMGGLLARKYILDNPDDHHVSTLISIGTPWLGAPKAVAMMLTGNFDSRLIKASTTKTLLEYFPGAHQLLPPRKYYDLVTKYNYPLRTFDDNNQPQYIGYNGFDLALHTLYRSPDSRAYYPSTVQFKKNNEWLFSNPMVSDWQTDTTKVAYFVLYGEGQVADTIAQVKYELQYSLGNAYYNFAEELTLGDGTVPLVSSTRKGNRANLNGTTATLLRFKHRGNKDDVDVVKHMDLPSNSRVQDCVLKLLGKNFDCDKDPIPTEVNAANAQDEVLPARYVSLWGITSLHVTDGISTTDNLMTNTLSLSALFPGIVFDYLGDDAAELIIPDGKQYQLTFGASNHLLSQVVYGTGESAQHLVRYTGLQVITGTQMALTTSATNLSSLMKDTNNDGSPDTLITPSGDLQGTQANDVTPPTVQITYTQSTHQVTMTAADDNSGVDRILYSVDGTRFFPYTQPLTVDPGTKVVYASAQDKLGNLSGLISQTVSSDTKVSLSSAAVSSAFPGWSAENLIDGKENTTWSSQIHWDHLLSAEWATVVLPQPTTIDRIRIRPRFGPANLSQGFPKDFVFQYADNGTGACDASPANWKPLLSYYGYNQPANNWLEFALPAPLRVECVRIYGTELSQDGYGNRYLQLGEVEVYTGTSKVSLSSAAVSSAFPGWSAENLIDGQENTTWSSQIHWEHLLSAEWATVVLPQPTTIDRIRIRPRFGPANLSQGFPKDFVFQYADNGTGTCDASPANWKPLLSYYGHAQPTNNWLEFALPAPLQVECVRIYGAELSQDGYGNRYLQLGEVELYAGTSKVSLASAAVSSAFPGWSAENLIDGQEKTTWSSQMHWEHLLSAEWATVVLPQPTTIDRIRIRPRFGPANLSQGFPKDFVFQYADNGTGTCDASPANWKPLLSYYGYAQPTNNWLEFTLPAPLQVECVRIYATELSQDGYGNRYLQLTEVELYAGSTH